MADAIISTVVERVADIIQDQIRYELNLVRDVEKEVLDVSDKLRTIGDVLDDAEKRGANDQSVKRWLKKLEDTAYEMDDILDEWNYTLLKHNVVGSAKQKVCCSFIPSSSLCFNKVSDRRKTAKKIQNVKASLDRILKERGDFKFVVCQPTTESLRPQSTSLIDVEKVHGVDIGRNKNDIVRKLMDNGDSQIVCVVGMGGIGKTTLAQLVFNDIQVKGCFDSRIWICVSDPFDVTGIAREIVNSVGIGIIQKVTNEIIPPNTNQLELALKKLRDSISGKKFFLVLDDVWTEDYNKWEPLKMSLDNGAQGSKILVTTRNDGVAKMMMMRGNVDVEIYRPEKLSDEECWTLLCRISLSRRSEEECGEFEDVGKKIASKCKGLPLAANVLGGLLESKNTLEEWENVLESEIWQLEKEKELFPHLFLSYNELSPTLKRCFSYCSVYPKDYPINAKKLIEEWMALGYLGSVAGKCGVEVKGRDYFNNLARRSLFQDFKKSGETEEIEWCKMHDIVHDFAQFLRNTIHNDRTEALDMTKRSCQVCNPQLLSQVQEYRSLVCDRESESPISICDCVTSIRVIRFGKILHGGYGLPQGMKKLIHLRCLELSDNELSKEDLNIICRIYFLQTLSLSSCYIEEIPSAIGNLVELRHLDLSRNRALKELPESMCSLVELQILNIEECYNLFRLPEGIHKLKNLEHLIADHNTPVSYHLPQGVGQLSGLRTLRLDTRTFSVGSGTNKLGLLKNLNRLTGYLALEMDISNINDLEVLVEDARDAELRNKIHIQRLKIVFNTLELRKDEYESLSPSSSLWMKVMEALEPNQNLKYLKIFGYKGSRLPDWMSSPLNLIKEIHLSCLSEVSSLPPMGKLPFLEDLNMDYLMQLKLVGREFLGIEESLSSSSTSNDGVVAFPKLKKLRFHDGPRWKEWEDITTEEEESDVVSIMPCLTELCILSCGHLKKLPHRLLRKTSSSLQTLDIRQSSDLLNSYKDKDGSPWRSIYQYNLQLQLSL